MSSIRVLLGGKSFDIEAEAGSPLLSALRKNGFTLPAACGGRGKCGKCRVVINGISRLACRAAVSDGDEVVLPDKGAGRILTQTVEIKHTAGKASGCAAAVDLGTTTVAVRLYDLGSGREEATLSAWNAQAAYGGDVISRIQHTIDCPDGLAELSRIIRGQVADMVTSALDGCARDKSELRHTVLAGNTVMQHIFACLPVQSIALAPFEPYTLFDAELDDTLLGAPLYYAPCVAGYVGGDITAGLMASGLCERDGRYLFLDIGTNGEMALGGKGGFRCCAVASGPAFEGAGISCGMAAVDGAVSHVRYDGGFLYDIIGSSSPHGLCGSGLIDLAAALLALGCIDEGGRLLPPEEAPEKMRRYLTRDENGNGVFHLTHRVCLTAQDVRNLQLAKGAVAAGIKVLLDEEGMSAAELDGVYLAGGFGSWLDPASAVRLGMLPDILHDKLCNPGNTALAGASMAALDPEKLGRMRDIAHGCNYIELSGRTDFADAFAGSMTF